MAWMVSDAFASGERSGTSAWNPVLWPFRFILFLGFAAFTLQVFAEIVKRIYSIAGRPIDNHAGDNHGSV